MLRAAGPWSPPPTRKSASGLRARSSSGRRPKVLAAARCLIYRDLLLALRRKSDAGTALLFFVIVASLFPLGVGAEPNLLRAIGPGVIWVAALLSSMLSLGRLFAADYADGTPAQIPRGAAPL